MIQNPCRRKCRQGLSSGVEIGSRKRTQRAQSFGQRPILCVHCVPSRLLKRTPFSGSPWSDPGNSTHGLGLLMPPLIRPSTPCLALSGSLYPIQGRGLIIRSLRQTWKRHAQSGRHGQGNRSPWPEAREGRYVRGAWRGFPVLPRRARHDEAWRLPWSEALAPLKRCGAAVPRARADKPCRTALGSIVHGTLSRDGEQPGSPPLRVERPPKAISRPD